MRLHHACNTMLATFLSALIMTGCSSNGRNAVSGDVTLDGKPMKDGSISFRPAPGNDSNTAGGTISNGKFYLPANHGLKPGKYMVTIQAVQLTGRKIKDPETGNLISELGTIRFKNADHLEATLTGDGASHLQYDLLSVAAQ